MKIGKWLNDNWRPIGAYVYFAVIIFDFIIMPQYMIMTKEKTTNMILAIKDLKPEVQIVYLNNEYKTWEPLSSSGGGLLHISFGAILGVSAFTRGQEKIEQMKQGIPNPSSPPNPPKNVPDASINIRQPRRNEVDNPDA